MACRENGIRAARALNLINDLEKVPPGGLAVQNEIETVNAWGHVGSRDFPRSRHILPGRHRYIAWFRFGDQRIVSVEQLKNRGQFSLHYALPRDVDHGLDSLKTLFYSRVESSRGLDP